jgi:dTDP-4-amino-4,6-dideoxygalactose transaminase
VKPVEMRVPLFDLEYDERERAAVARVLDSKWLTMGDETAAFEEAFARAQGAKHAIAVSNATAALHMAVRALGIGPGDEVIVPDLTFIATAHAAVFEGAMPVLADCTSENDLTISPTDIERKMTPRTKAIIPMHYGGYPCDMGAIMSIADEHGIAVIEDAAHAPGATWEGRGLGTVGAAGCFSFFSNKNLSVGEGGMITTEDDELARRFRLIRSHGMTAQTLDRHKGHAWGYDIAEVGWNYRMTEIEAALGIVQLEKLCEGNRLRGQWVTLYRRLIAADLPGVTVPFSGFDEGEWSFAGTSAYHLMEVLLPEGASQRAVADAMRAAGVATSVHYRPIHTFTSSHLTTAPAEGLEVVKSIQHRLLTLPLYPGMGEDAVEYVVEALRDALARKVD